MKPGRELDALIAEKVMGYSLKTEDCNSFWVDSDGEEPTHCHDYSTDIAAAWEVVEKLCQYMPSIRITENAGDFFYEAEIGNNNYGSSTESPAHAICLAALKAVGHAF